MLKSATESPPPPPPHIIRYGILLFVIVALVAAAASITISITQAQAANGVYDTDGDKLIEIDNLEQLDAVRYDLDGNGRADNASDNANYAAAFPVSGSDKVCTIGCKGYELERSLDFDSDASFASGSINFDWFSGLGWSPIGNFAATFDGNGHTISNLYVNRPAADHIGLFGSGGSAAAFKGIGLLNADVTGRAIVGALLGVNRGTVSHSYAIGSVTAANSRGSSSPGGGGLVGWNRGENSAITTSYAHVTVTSTAISAYSGGLVGQNDGTINGSYATGTVSGGPSGGLVGLNYGTGAVTGSYATGVVSSLSSSGGLVVVNYGTISNSYATGEVSGDAYAGGLVSRAEGTISSSYAIGEVSGARYTGGLHNGQGDGTITNSYWNTDITAQGDGGGEGKTTAELKAPTSRTGIYARWDPQYWDFGTSSQYPLLKADMNGDGTATWREFGPQIAGERPLPTPTPIPTGDQHAHTNGHLHAHAHQDGDAQSHQQGDT